METATLTGPPRQSIRVPTAPNVERESAPAYSVERPLAGLRVGLRTEGDWRSWITVLDTWEPMLRAGGAIPVRIVASQQRVGSAGAEVERRIAEWAESVDCGISGLGTCGSCTLVSTQDAVTLEAAGRPAALAVTEEFAVHARNMSTFRGHPNMKLLVLPHPLEGRSEAELVEIARDYFPKFLDLLGIQA